MGFPLFSDKVEQTQLAYTKSDETLQIKLVQWVLLFSLLIS